jgi:aspartokinase-like uncharacterized kinase
MWVIKLGGSLGDAPVLQQWLDTLARQGRGRAVIVPGGGAFAEQVRIAQRLWEFDDITAHRMAILAMQQMALMYHGLNAELCIAGSLAEICTTLRQNKAVVWSPDYAALDRAGIAAGWDVTSDSLAAWLARELHASGLILVKSAQVPQYIDFIELAEQDIVDKAFASFATGLRCPVKFVNRDELRVFTDCLKW